MPVRIERLDARTRTDAELAALSEGAWPAFISADQTVASIWDRVRAEFAHLDLAAVDESALVATGWAVPVHWDRTRADLPAGFTGTLVRALENLDANAGPNTLVICAAQIHPGLQRTGLAAQLLNAFIDLAPGYGLESVLVPLRPTLKHRYPLTPISAYAGWTRSDGQPFDPWLRTHLRMGAKVLCPIEASQTMTGTVAEWETWTGLVFPESGTYVIDGGLSTLTINTQKDQGIYNEPGIWVQHR
jgi:GNAT superfamily N-acetyltransferase